MNLRLHARVAVAATLVAAGLFSPSLAIGQSAAGQAVEVRDGIVWSPATEIGREGDTVKVRYADGRVASVPSSRVRPPKSVGLPAGGTSAKAGAATKPSVPSTPKPGAAPVAKRFPIGTAVEVNVAMKWYPGTVRNTRGEWYLVAITDKDFPEMDWVEPWRIRKAGDSYEVDYRGLGHRFSMGTTKNPPSEKPGPNPQEEELAAEDAKNISWPVTSVSSGPASTVKLPAAIEWKYRPVAASLPVAPATMEPIKLVGGVQKNGADDPVAFDVAGAFVLAGFQSTQGDKKTTAEIVELATGRQVARAEMDPATLPQSVSPDGKWVVARSIGFGNLQSRIDVWELDGTAPAKHVVSYRPFIGETQKEVWRVFALEGGRVLTIGTEGQVLVCQVGPGSVTPVWRAKLDASRVGAALSPDRKTVALLADGKLLLLDVADGHAVGAIPTSAGVFSSPSFSGDGKRLAAYAGATVYAFDLESGKQTIALGLPQPLISSNVEHLGGDLLCLWSRGGAFTLDLAKKELVSTYEIPNIGLTTTVGDRLLAFVRTGDRRSICNWALPAEPGKGMPLNVIQTGPSTKVAIDIQIDADAAGQKKVSDGLARQVAARGWKIAGPGETPDFRIVAKTEDGKPEQQTFEVVGMGMPGDRPQESINTTAKISRLSIEIGGKRAWAVQSSSGVGSFLNVAAGQTAQQAADAARTTNVSLLGSTTLPETLCAPLEALPAGLPMHSLSPGSVK